MNIEIRKANPEEAEKIIAVVEKLREHYPAEGIACFTSSAESR